MNILVLALPAVAGWGGSEELWADTARVALNDGHCVWITPRIDDSGNDSRLRELVSLGAVLISRERFRSGGGPQEVEVVPNAAYEVVRSVDAILLSAGGSMRELIDPAVLRLIEVSRPTPLIVTVRLVSERDLLTDTERERARAVLQLLSGVVLPAQRSREILERVLASQIPQTTIVPSPIRRDLPGVLPWPMTTTARFACVARLSPIQKGQDLLLEAFASPRWYGRDWHLTFVGRGAGRNYLEELVKHYALTDRVTFAGFQEKVTDVWSDNELLILPSREESMPIAVLEAMYCGRPCLVTDVGDNTKFVRAGDTGFVAHGARLAALSHALQTAWESRPCWPEMGRRAHSLYMQIRDPSPGRTVLSLLLSAN